MADLGGLFGGDFNLTGSLMSLVTSWIFWVGLIIILVVGGIVALKVRKNKKMKLLVMEITFLGNNKIGMVLTKGGWFKKQRKFWGLIESGGEEELLTKTNKVVYGACPEDYQEFQYNKTLLCTPNPDDPKMLFPLNKFELSRESKKMLFDIAPTEIREAGVDAYQKTTREMKSKFDMIMPYVLGGMFFIAAVLCIVFITQYASHAIDKASEMMDKTATTLKQISDQVTTSPAVSHSTSIPSTGAP